MNPDPDYSAAYVILHTDSPDGLAGHGMTFTIGRGNEICVRAIESLAPLVIGWSLETITADWAAYYRHLTGDSQLRWIGPEKGAIHLATAAIVNALWDLQAKASGKPLWRLLAEMTPEELVGCIDFRYLTDAITPEAARELLEAQVDGKAERMELLKRDGYPAYTTSAGWLGYSDGKLRELCRTSLEAGWNVFKIKVGRDLQDDVRRCEIIREEIGSERRLMMDANQVWDVHEAIRWMKELARFDPWFIEEPTSPDDVLGHAAIARAVAPIRVATGEHCANRVMFKQFMQAGAIGVCQVDACRLGESTRYWRSCCWRRTSIFRFAHTPVELGCASTCSTFRCLTTSRSPDHSKTESPSTPVTCTSTSSIRSRCAGGRYRPPTAPGYSNRNAERIPHRTRSGPSAGSAMTPGDRHGDECGHSDSSSLASRSRARNRMGTRLGNSRASCWRDSSDSSPAGTRAKSTSSSKAGELVT